VSLARIRRGELVAGLGGAVLLISLFLPWFEPGRSGFDSLAVADLLVAAAALAAIALPLLSAGHEKTDVPVVAATVTVIGSLIAIAIVAFRLLDPIGGGSESGLYLALAASIVTLAGSYSAMADEGD
jgi:hypothetical protein